jgi:hypothetical protein
MDDEAVEATLARIYSRDDRKDDYAALEIDAVLQSRSQSKRLPLIRPLAEAKFLTRRAMEVGFYAVLKIRQNSRPESDAGFESLEDNAKKASNAIGKVLRSLDPSAKAGAEFELAIVTTLGGIPGVVDAGALHCLARQDGEYLCRAREILDRLSRGAASKRTQLRETRPASTKPQHLAFGKVLAECWISLTGRAPGTNPDHSRNPFLKFVSAAWIEVFDHDRKSDPGTAKSHPGPLAKNNQQRQARAHKPSRRLVRRRPNGVRTPEFIGALRLLKFSDGDVAHISRNGPWWR